MLERKEIKTKEVIEVIKVMQANDFKVIIIEIGGEECIYEFFRFENSEKREHLKRLLALGYFEVCWEEDINTKRRYLDESIPRIRIQNMNFKKGDFYGAYNYQKEKFTDADEFIESIKNAKTELAIDIDGVPILNHDVKKESKIVDIIKAAGAPMYRIDCVFIVFLKSDFRK